MKRTLRIILLLAGLYVAYIGTGLGLLYTKKANTWPVFPGKVITVANWDVDNSDADVDGPYVFYTDGSIIRRSVVRKGKELVAVSDTFTAAGRKDITVTCTFPDHPDWSFTTRLKDTLVNEQAVYPAASELLAISDIEGNFEAFRSLLLAGGVMDKDYHWRFGDGHLVLVGDFFDRGLYVTECLWLVYHLEEEAARAGGKVHFVLGNHEIMNMQDDVRYVRTKYLKNGLLLKADYETWYGPETELGRWLQTKNIVEQVGPILFVHGGISEEVEAMNLPLSRLNELARPWYFADKARLKNDAPDEVKTLTHSKSSPFWYRGLVKEEASAGHVNAVLEQYGASTIVVGHTVVDNIRKMYGGKVVAMDVKHAEGTVQALRVQGGKFLRMDTSGKLVAL